MNRESEIFRSTEIFEQLEPSWNRNRRSEKIMRVACWLVVGIAIPFAFSALLHGLQVLASITFALMCGATVGLYLLKRSSVTAAAHVTALTVMAYQLAIAIVMGEAAYPWFFSDFVYLVPVAIAAHFVFIGDAAWWRWVYSVGCGFLVWAIATNMVPNVAIETAPIQFATMGNHSGIVGSFIAVMALTVAFVNDINAAERDLQIANGRLEALLENMLPSSIATRLRLEGHTFADGFDHCSILFADIVGFTEYSEREPPEHVVGMLNQVFSQFDELVAKFGLEKIKTIGDAYMVAAGVPQPRADHAHAMVDFALAMIEVMKAYPALELRIGINSGQVVAGVIGKRRFIYDLWGDAVNVAARMESHGLTGKVQVSEATNSLISADFDLEFRGTIPIKGKGDMPVYLVHGRLPA